ncbi:hypothetical protein SAMN05421820_102181 [Pedobacter steynii]|uniref:Uncharacterized protein n=2 Tax=Pedobacter steynii TaxID=430522 RepID=A0A1G9N2L7_9SPHI|nr:hypothetical protein SAMN05421820_102181 [Pedobacter steynii]
MMELGFISHDLATKTNVSDKCFCSLLNLLFGRISGVYNGIWTADYANVCVAEITKLITALPAG